MKPSGDAAAASGQHDFEGALAAEANGRLLEEAGAPASLRDLAAIVPEIVGSLEPELLQRVAERIGAGPDGTSLCEVLLISDCCLHVIRPLPRRPGVVLVATAPAVGNIGLLLSRVQARATLLEEQR